MGYNLLVWSSVIRPGDQVNTVVNGTQVPSNAAFGPLTGPAQPAAPFDTTAFWAHGLSFGLSFLF